MAVVCARLAQGSMSHTVVRDKASIFDPTSNGMLRFGCTRYLGHLPDCCPSGLLWWTARVQLPVVVKTLQGWCAMSKLPIADLSSTDACQRRRAIDAIVEVPTEMATSALVEALANPDVSVRAAAAIGLQRRGWAPTGDGQVTAFLIATQRWNDLTDRLVERQRSQDVSPEIERVVETLGDLDANTRAGAAGVLRQLGWSPTTQTNRALLAIAEQRWAEAAEQGDIGFSLLVVALADEQSRVQIVPLLAASFEDAFETLVEGLEDPETLVRQGAASALLDMKEQSVGPLITLIKSNEAEPELETIVILLLGRIGDATAVEALLERTTRAQWSVTYMQGSHDVQHKNALLSRAGSVAMAQLVQEDPLHLVALLESRWDHENAQTFVRVACDALRCLGGKSAQEAVEALKNAWRARKKFGPSIDTEINSAIRGIRRDLVKQKPSGLLSFDQALEAALAARPIPRRLARALPRDYAAGFGLALPAAAVIYVVGTVLLQSEWATNIEWLASETLGGFIAVFIPTYAVVVARSLSRRRAARSQTARKSLVS